MPSWIGEDRLIPLKAVAWMEMTERVQQGEEIDLKKINKHLNDIVLLSALLQPGQVIDLPEKIKSDLQDFAKFVVAINRTEQVQAMRRRGCTEFCVNGLMAGNRRISRSGYDLKHKESSTQRSH
jgi:hypothetical protein